MPQYYDSSGPCLTEPELAEIDDADAWRIAGEAIARLWDYIFSDAAGRPFDPIDQHAAQVVIRNFFVITLMVRPDRLPGCQSLRALALMLNTSHETLSRIQLRAADKLNLRSRSQRARPSEMPVAMRVAKSKANNKVKRRAKA